MHIDKQYARRSVAGYRSPYENRFEYRSLSRVGNEVFAEALESINANAISRDIGRRSGADELVGLIEFAGSAFAPEDWELAYLEGSLVGVVCPQRYFDKPEEGSVFHLGVHPDFRGRGHARVLHAHGLEQLARAGVTEYVGSTDVLNQPMIAVFVANGCRLTAIRSCAFEH